VHALSTCFPQVSTTRCELVRSLTAARRNVDFLIARNYMYQSAGRPSEVPFLIVDNFGRDDLVERVRVRERLDRAAALLRTDDGRPHATMREAFLVAIVRP
jgi:hypothetical protein